MHRSCYVWSSTSPPLEVHVALEVVQHLSLEALEALKSIPRRGLEIGGLLLGRSETRDEVPILSIDDYLPVESEHRAGPSYRLSPSELEELDQLVRSHPAAIGLYRTNTRSEDISLQEDDGAILKYYLNSGWRLFLMIQPASRMAALFVTENGVPAAEHQFPFRPADLAIQAVREEFSPPISPAPAAEAPRTAEGLLEAAAATKAPAPEATPAGIPVRRRRWLLPAAAMLAGIAGGAAASFLYFQPWHHAPPAAPAIATAPGHMVLQVQRVGDALHLVWDGNSPVARAATHGVLHITDGNLHSSMDLYKSELAGGLVSYWPTTGEVSFELQTFGPGRSTDDTVSAISPMAPVRQSKVEMAAVPANATPLRKRLKRSEPADSDRVIVAETKPSPSPAPAEQGAPLESRVPEPILTPETEPAPSKPVAMAAVPSRALSDVSVSAEPVHRSRWGRMASHIPLLRRRLKKSPQAYVPPQPVHQVKPALTARQRGAITKPVPVDVKVYVSEAGRVQYAELVSGRNRDLEAAAVFAARQWRFTPARVGGENVAGEMILHFRFGVNH